MNTTPIKQLILILCFIGLVKVNAQYDNEFWFAAPDISNTNYNNSIPLNLHVVARHPTSITISRPADDSFIPIEMELEAMETAKVNLDSVLDVDDIEVYAHDISNPTFLQDKGFRLESDPAEVYAFYELGGLNNADIMPLKGANALGTNFWVSTQRKYKNHGYPDDFSGFVVVATEDNTVVSIDPNSNGLYIHGTAPFMVTLNEGQTFAVHASGQNSADHVYGIHVTSNKEIAITIYDDCMQIDDGGGNWDVFMDQLIPAELAGTEFVIVKGHVQDNAGIYDGESIFITSTEDNTDIYADGAYIATMVNAGDYFQYNITLDASFIKSSKPVLVNHITGYSTDASGSRELGGAVVPAMDMCTGSYDVMLKRSLYTGLNFYNNLVVRNDTIESSPNKNQAIRNFTYSIDGGAAFSIPESHFTYIMDSAYAYYDRVKAGGSAYYLNVDSNQILLVHNSTAPFHLGVIMAKQSPSSSYGYFSNYSAVEAKAGIKGTISPLGTHCGLDSVLLAASGGTLYQWSTPGEPELVNSLSSDTIATPYFQPDEVGVYDFEVNIQGECVSNIYMTRVVVWYENKASFDLSVDEGCSPLEVQITNTTAPNSEDDIMIWEFGTSHELMDQDTVPLTFNRSIINSGDTTELYPINLIVYGPANMCPDEFMDTVIIHPYSDQVANFAIINTAANCEGKTIQFVDYSGGSSVDSVSWNLGDGNIINTLGSFEHFYERNTGKDTIYHVRLELIDTIGCIAFMEEDIELRQRVDAAISFTDTAGCSPFTVTASNLSDGLTDSSMVKWYVGQEYITEQNNFDSTFRYLSESDSIRIISMNISNEDGCADSTSQNIYIYPSPHGNMYTQLSGHCSPVDVSYTVQFENTDSVSWLVQHAAWEHRTDTILAPFSFTLTDTTYPVADTFAIHTQFKNNYGCVNSSDSTIIVYPQAKASFTMDTSEGRSPLMVQFTNLSERADTFIWHLEPFMISYAAEPEYEFITFARDTFDIMLVATNSQCPDTAYNKVIVYDPLLSNSYPGLFTSYNCYYNPETSDIIVKLSLHEPSLVTLALYNVTGSRIYTVQPQHFESGEFQLSIPLHAQTNGIYFVKLLIGNLQSTAKIIKQY